AGLSVAPRSRWIARFARAPAPKQATVPYELLSLLLEVAAKIPPRFVVGSRAVALPPAVRDAARHYVCCDFRELCRGVTVASAASRRGWLWKPERLEPGQHLTTRTVRLRLPIETPSYVRDLVKPT